MATSSWPSCKAAADEMISVIVELREKESLSDLRERLRKNQIKKIIQRLQQKALKTQKKVIELVESRIADGTAASYTSFWMINGVEVTATSAVIMELAKLRIVEEIVLNVPVAAPAAPPAEFMQAPAALQNGAPEPNIALVNAPALWSQGYLGRVLWWPTWTPASAYESPGPVRQMAQRRNGWFDPAGPARHADRLIQRHTGHGTWTMGIMVGGDAGRHHREAPAQRPMDCHQNL
ncbi:MAG: hypothetical protein R2911_15080 [Caldilineaceae bacterium]